MPDDTEFPTCGAGLAESSALPEKLAELISAMADFLAAHMRALDLDDIHSKQEYEAYKDLVRELKQVAAGLLAIAQKMAGYRDLPMGRHDESVMADPRAVEVFRDYVNRKQQLLAYLQETFAQDQTLLDQM
jgi:hypothetical protein